MPEVFVLQQQQQHQLQILDEQQIDKTICLQDRLNPMGGHLKYVSDYLLYFILVFLFFFLFLSN